MESESLVRAVTDTDAGAPGVVAPVITVTLVVAPVPMAFTDATVKVYEVPGVRPVKVVVVAAVEAVRLPAIA
jgi:hypothetical protein